MTLLNKKILCVDDSKALRRIVSKFLEEVGFTNIYLAGNGAQALEILEKNHVDLIFSDWKMPVMNGLELLKYVRASDEFQHIPFVMVTAEGLKKHVTMAEDEGVTTIISKPFTAKSLAEIIFSVFQGEINNKRVQSDASNGTAGDSNKETISLSLTEVFLSNLSAVEKEFLTLSESGTDSNPSLMRTLVELSEKMLTTMDAFTFSDIKRTTEAKIMNIDDVAMNSKIVSRHLNKLGFMNIYEENSSVSALEKLKKEKFDLIISDMHMPDILGIDVLKSIRENSVNKKTPFIMITYDNKSRLLIDAVQSRLDCYIIKPVTINQLKEKLTLLKFEFNA